MSSSVISFLFLYPFCVGVISLSRSLHGKANSVITMVISAKDGGGLNAPINAKVNISVVEGSVAPPVFEQAQYFFTISEDVLRGTEVGVVRASSRTSEFLSNLHTLNTLPLALAYKAMFTV